MSEIKEKVYELLWELFLECPYIKNIDYLFDKFHDFKLYLNVDSNGNENGQIWTILDEILPDEIGIINGRNYLKRWYPGLFPGLDGSLEKRHLVRYMGADDDLTDQQWMVNIWQAFLSLLNALKNHKDRDNMRFVWGEK